MTKRIALAVFYLMLLTVDAHAARGLFISTSATCADVPSPEADLTYCLPSTGSNKNQLLVYNGSSFVAAIAAAGSETDPVVGAVTGIVKADGAGNISAATAGTDYYKPGGTDVAVTDGGTGASTAGGARTNLGLVISTDVAPATSGSAILKGNGSGGFSNAAAGTDYAAAPSGSANTPLFNAGSGGFTNGTRSGNTTRVVTMDASTPSTDDCAKFDANGNLTTAGASCGTSGGGSAFNDLTGGTNTTAAMVVGTGASLAVSGSGTIAATTAAALAANPSDCSSDQYANAIAANGNLTCSAVTDAQISTSDITTNDVSSTKHGFTPKSPADATKFLNGAATPAFAAVKDSDLSTSDITTNDVSTSKHGFAPKGDGSTTKFLNANGAYSTPAGGGWVLAGSFTWSTNVTSVSFTNLGSYSEILLIARAITLSSGGFRNIQVSSDNGSNYYSSSGDYATISNDGTETNQTGASIQDANTALARGGIVAIQSWNLTTTKVLYTINRGNVSYVITPAAAMNAIKLFPSGGGNITGGSILLYGR